MPACELNVSDPVLLISEQKWVWITLKYRSLSGRCVSVMPTGQAKKAWRHPFLERTSEIVQIEISFSRLQNRNFFSDPAMRMWSVWFDMNPVVFVIEKIWSDVKTHTCTHTHILVWAIQIYYSVYSHKIPETVHFHSLSRYNQSVYQVSPSITSWSEKSCRLRWWQSAISGSTSEPRSDECPSVKRGRWDVKAHRATQKMREER